MQLPQNKMFVVEQYFSSQSTLLEMLLGNWLGWNMFFYHGINLISKIIITG